jgi:hypothetical protein
MQRSVHPGDEQGAGVGFSHGRWCGFDLCLTSKISQPAQVPGRSKGKNKKIKKNK